MPRDLSPARVAALATVGAAVVLYSYLYARSRFVDLDVYVLGGRAVLDRADLYALSTAEDLPFTYPPFAAVLFAPLAVVPVGLARLVMVLGAVASVVLVVRVLGRRLGLDPVLVATLAVGAFALEPVARTILMGQLNLVILALVVADLFWAKGSHRGWLVGLAAGTKLVPGIFILYFALRRDWRAVRASSAAFLATVVVGAVAAPHASVRYWSGGFAGLGKFGADTFVGSANQSLVATLQRFTHAGEAPSWLAAACCLVAVVAGVLVARRQLRRGDAVAGACALGIAGLLGSPVSWTHHWVWCLPVLVLLVARGRVLLAWLVAAVFAVGPMWVLPSGPTDPLAWPWWRTGYTAAYLLLGVGFLVWAACAPLARTQARPVGPG